jgi:hypothetical protein
MKVFRVSPPRRVWTDGQLVLFIVLGGSALVILSFGLLALAPSIVDRDLRHLIGAVSVLSVVAGIPSITFLALRFKINRENSKFTYLLTETELTRRAPGFPDIRLDLDQIVVLTREKGYLLAGTHSRLVRVPVNVNNFDTLLAELGKRCPVPQSGESIPTGILPLAASILAWCLMFYSHRLAVVYSSTLAGVLLLMWSTVGVVRKSFKSSRRIAIWSVLALSWLAALTLVFHRIVTF